MFCCGGSAAHALERPRTQLLAQSIPRLSPFTFTPLCLCGCMCSCSSRATMEASWLSKFKSERSIDRYFNTTDISVHDPRQTGEEVSVRRCWCSWCCCCCAHVRLSSDAVACLKRQAKCSRRYLCVALVQISLQMLARWVSCPMWINGPQQGGRPDGLLLLGDVVNGEVLLAWQAPTSLVHCFGTWSWTRALYTQPVTKRVLNNFASHTRRCVACSTAAAARLRRQDAHLRARQ
jgi:hypothetical protein